MTDQTASQPRNPAPETAPPPAPEGLLARLWRRLTGAALPPEQAEVLSRIKFPCC
jgi:hypothetical protein